MADRYPLAKRGRDDYPHRPTKRWCESGEVVAEEPRPSYVFFWKPVGTFGFLSNWSQHDIVEDGIRFPTVEHYMMYQKASLMGDLDTAARILEVSAPGEVKKLGRSVRNYDDSKWQRERTRVVTRGLLLKASQHSRVMYDLLETYPKTIAETSPYDTIWGIGLGFTDDRVRDQRQWKGQNLLGECWMKVRDTLRQFEG